MKAEQSPYECHLFVCTKSRNGERKSCGDGDNGEIRAILKDEIKNRGWKGKVRVSESSCLGVCDAGPNIMIYPQRIWLSAVTLHDVPAVLDLVKELIGE